MSTEAQRARNARKRAKLRAHRHNQQGPTPVVTHMYTWEFAVRGVKNPFPADVEDADIDSPYLPHWAFEYDYIPCSIVAPKDASLVELKAQIRRKVEVELGISRWDLQVKFLNRFWTY